MDNKTYKKIEQIDPDDLINYRPVKIKSYNYYRKRTQPITDRIIKLKIKKLIKNELDCEKLKLIFNTIRKIMENDLINEKGLDETINKQNKKEYQKVNQIDKLNTEIQELNNKLDNIKKELNNL